MLNKENIVKLMDHVAVSDHFDMNVSKHCFIGHAAECAGKVVDRFNSIDLAPWLGLTDEQREDLCFPLTDKIRQHYRQQDGVTQRPNTLRGVYMDAGTHGYVGITREHGVKVLAHLCDTGKVDWGII